MGKIIALTAKSKNGQVFPRPKVVYVNDANIMVIPAVNRTLRGSKVVEQIGSNKDTYVVYEMAEQIEARRNPITTDLENKQHIAVGLAGVGTVQGGQALTKYFNELLTLGVGATDACTLPAATVGKVCIVVNNDASGDTLKVFPAVGEFIESQAVNTVYNVLSGKTIAFVCPTTAGKWKIADDYGR